MQDNVYMSVSVIIDAQINDELILILMLIYNTDIMVTDIVSD